MKTQRIIAPDLKIRLMIALLSRSTLSFALDITVEYEGEMLPAKLCLETRNQIFYKEGEEMISFAGVVKIGEKKIPCTGFYYTKGEIEECYLTIIIPETKFWKIEISKTDFIEKAKEYYVTQNITSEDDGNICDQEFPLFANMVKKGEFKGELLLKDKKSPERFKFHTILCKNLFPIESMMTGEVVFGEFVEENRIKIHSKETALAIGIRFY
ncbi:MAG: hypothetical protein NT085_02850 [candidate division SR1 bacterium]|nr:hypothetical protein [candidate division SR1 bacterium]